MFTIKALLRVMVALSLLVSCPMHSAFAESNETASKDHRSQRDSDVDEAEDINRGEKNTSQSIRKDQLAHLSFFVTYLIEIVQVGGDLDIMISDQWSVGVTSTYWETISIQDVSSDYNTYGLHIKRYFGNSFYIKPSLGWHRHVKSSMTDFTSPDDGKKVSEGAGLHVELGHDWSFNRYIGIGITYFAIGSIFDPDNMTPVIMSRGPSLRLIGSF